jgi:hypothetical protein
VALAIVAVLGGGSVREAAAQRLPAPRPETPRASQPLAGLERLREWLTAVERHKPGELDEPAIAVSRWSHFELDAVLADLLALVWRTSVVVSHVQWSGKDATIKTESGPLTLSSVRELLGLTDDDLRRRDPTRIVKRAAVLHADVAAYMALGLVADASYAGMMIGESDVGRALLLVFSDGRDSWSWLLSDEVLDIARRCDAVVYGVSVGQAAKSNFLRDLSDVTGGKHIEIESTMDLSAVFLSVLDEFRNRYVVSYSPRGVSPDGWHQLTVRVKGGRATVKARPGYLAGS